MIRVAKEKVTKLNGRTLTIVCSHVARIWLSMAILFCTFDASFAGNEPAVKTLKDSALVARISKLIEQLGSDHYATRQQAQAQLQQIGVPALDQLRAAILDSDPQVATIARFLFRSSFVNWTSENDPLEVRKLLEHYGTGDLSYRAERISRLASISDDRGLPALLRIAIFEVDGRLSRSAALLILDAKQRIPLKREANEKLNQRWETVLDAVSDGQNRTCQWLAEFARSNLTGKKLDPAFWIAAVEGESKLLQEKSIAAAETSVEFLHLFARFVAEQLVEQGMRDDALNVGMRLLDFEYRDRNKNAPDLSLWALEKGLPELVIEQSSRPWMNGVRHTQLDYLLAESYLRVSQPEKAEEAAERAFSRGGSNATVLDRAAHGEFLNQRQLYKWAEREYRAALQIADPLDKLTVTITYVLQKMLVDGMDHAGAVEVLEPLIERFEKEPAFAREIDDDPNFGSRGSVLGNQDSATYTASLKALHLHNKAIAKIKEGKLEDAKQHLRVAWKADPDNVDVAITMWKNRADPEWNSESEQAIQQAIKEFRDVIPKMERDVRGSGTNDLATYESNYANTLNTYAWVLVSTDRDLETALECSQRACRLSPNNAAYLDTLARCYFKAGKIEEAIRYQKEAVASEAWSREISRSLEEYEAALPKPH